MNDDLYNLTVSELDDKLDKLDLPKSGLKQDKIDRLTEYPEQETPEAGRVKPEVTTDEMKSYTVRMWAGKIPVYVCDFCGLQRDDKDRMILHVIAHYPESKRDKIFNQLVKD